jgi:hypothetical protein
MPARAARKEAFDAVSCVGGDDRARCGEVRQLGSLWRTACERWLQAAPPARVRDAPYLLDEGCTEEAA